MNESEPGQPEHRASGPPPRIYVASLSDYNSGILHGWWIEATTDPEDMQGEIDKMLAASPTARLNGEVAEEWAIHDYEGFGGIGVDENQALSTVARLTDGIRRHGHAFSAWVAHVGESSDDLIEQFEDRYQGEWDAVTSYAEHLLDELDANRVIVEAPEWLQPYLKLDVEGFARDLEIGGDIVMAEAPSGRVWIFSR